MNKIQALANEMKQFFSPQTVTNGTWRLLQANSKYFIWKSAS